MFGRPPRAVVRGRKADNRFIDDDGFACDHSAPAIFIESFNETTKFVPWVRRCRVVVHTDSRTMLLEFLKPMPRHYVRELGILLEQRPYLRRNEEIAAPSVLRAGCYDES